jgi:DNA invertase Pin-like site-specific DNA recombinase
VRIGYMRVSKADGSQVLDLQRDALLAAGVKPSRLYQDQASGKKDDRPGLEACLKSLREADTLIVWKLDRLGRNLRHLVNTIHDLMERKIGFRVLTGQGAKELGVTRQTLYRFVDPKGKLRADGTKLLKLKGRSARPNVHR